VKKIITSLLLVAACRTTPISSSSAPVMRGNQTGAPDPVSAVNAFFDAIKKQDLQAMGAIWGGPDGPARDLWAQDELYKRELVIMCYVRNDRYDILGDAPSPAGGRAIALNITYKDLSRATTANVVQGPGNRWYVREVDPKPLSDICARRG
jgi:hypothetical protein